MTLRAVGVAIGLAFALASAGWADDLRTTERFNATHVGFEFGEPYRNVTLSVAGPNDFAARAFSKSGAPTIDLRGFGAVRDGSYTYQLTASTDAEVTAEARTQQWPGRRSESDFQERVGKRGVPGQRRHDRRTRERQKHRPARSAVNQSTETGKNRK